MVAHGFQLRSCKSIPSSTSIVLGLLSGKVLSRICAHGLICFLPDSVKFDGISGRRWDWLTLLRWLEFVAFGVYFGDFQAHFDGFLVVSGC